VLTPPPVPPPLLFQTVSSVIESAEAVIFVPPHPRTSGSDAG